MNVFAALAEFERTIIIERCQSGRAEAKRKGKKCIGSCESMELNPVGDNKNRPTATSRISQLPHQESANCHIKNRPTATFIVKKVAEFEI